MSAARQSMMNTTYSAPLLENDTSVTHGGTFQDPSLSGFGGTTALFAGDDAPTAQTSTQNHLGHQRELGGAQDEFSLEEHALAMLAQRRSDLIGVAVKRSLVCLLCTPFIGTIFIGIGLRERKHRSITSNPTDWMVLVWVGFCAQMSLVTPLVNIVATDAQSQLSDTLHSDADYIGPFIVYPAMCLYLVSTCIAFLAYSTSRRLAQYERPRDVIIARGRRRRGRTDLLENMQLIKQSIQDETIVPSWTVIIASFVTGSLQMLGLRVCKYAGISLESSDGCAGATFTFSIAKFNVVYYHFATLFWLLTFSALTGMVYLSLISYYQQLRQIERFTYYTSDQERSGTSAGGGGNSPTTPRNESPRSPRSPRNPGRAGSGGEAEDIALSGSLDRSPSQARLSKKIDRAKDIFSPKNLSLWISVWKELLRDLRERPAMQALILCSVICSLLSSVTTAVYVVFDNIFKGAEVAEFTSGCAAVFIFCVLAVAGFVFITVRLQYVVDYQIKAISETQTYVQRQLELEMNRYSSAHSTSRTDPSRLHHGVDTGLPQSSAGAQATVDARYQMLKAKVNVLQALDTLLRTSESKPKLLGLSLESIRWSSIIAGLFILNAAFFVLYRRKCHPV